MVKLNELKKAPKYRPARSYLGRNENSDSDRDSQSDQESESENESKLSQNDINEEVKGDKQTGQEGEANVDHCGEQKAPRQDLIIHKGESCNISRSTNISVMFESIKLVRTSYGSLSKIDCFKDLVMLYESK